MGSVMNRVLSLALLSMVSSALGAQTTQPSTQEKTLLATADSVLAMISRGNWISVSDLMTSEATTMSVRGGDTVRYRVRTRDEVRAQSSQGKITERGFDGTAHVSGPLGMVWLPYDLYVDGKWSHCGVDVFTFVTIDGKWRIAKLAWTVEQPPACRKHPAGPPGD
jgi:hypothetical protein